MVPKKVNVFGVIMTVVMDATLDEKLLAGQLSWEERKISINPSLDPYDQMHTLVHELFHGCVRRTGIGQTCVIHDLEEIIVENFATVILENFELRPIKKNKK